MTSSDTSWPPTLVTTPKASLRTVLMLCGVLSSLLYIATDIIGGMRYDGYSFASQAVSELMAIGSPSEKVVDPLFLLYDALVIAFGVGVLRATSGRRRALRLTGAALIGYGTIGLAGPTLFEMHQRGSGNLHGDVPHIIVTGAMVLLTFVIIGVGAFLLGKRFRLYSFGTLLVMVVAGALSVPFGARLAAAEPTPGFGIIERIDIYTSLFWIAAFAIALWRHQVKRANTSARVTPAAQVSGFVAPGFETVRVEFERNFAERGEIGAAVAAYWRGEKVVDLWGGRRTPNGDAPWNEDTVVAVMSTTKGLAAMTLAVANARGWLDYDAPVARYWAEFAQNDKGAITVRQLLGHEAGLVLLDETLTVAKLRDLDYVARVLARQKPAWPPGTRHGYHTMTLGLYMQELIRRVDPAHRSLGQFFHEEIAVPLGLDFYIRHTMSPSPPLPPVEPESTPPRGGAGRAPGRPMSVRSPGTIVRRWTAAPGGTRTGTPRPSGAWRSPLHATRQAPPR